MTPEESIEWTPPAEAVEAAARAMWKSVGGDHVAPTSPAYIEDARAALIAARPLLVAEALAEVERLTTEVGRWRVLFASPERGIEVIEESDKAHDRLAAVAALADAPDLDAHGAAVVSVADLRGVLAAARPALVAEHDAETERLIDELTALKTTHAQARKSLAAVTALVDNRLRDEPGSPWFSVAQIRTALAGHTEADPRDD